MGDEGWFPAAIRTGFICMRTKCASQHATLPVAELFRQSTPWRVVVGTCPSAHERCEPGRGSRRAAPSDDGAAQVAGLWKATRSRISHIPGEEARFTRTTPPYHPKRGSDLERGGGTLRSFGSLLSESCGTASWLGDADGSSIFSGGSGDAQSAVSVAEGFRSRSRALLPFPAGSARRR